MTRRQVSIKEIAELAGVSYPTVSRALRGEGRISAATRTRILNIAQDHSYTPSLAARSLVSKRSCAVGLVLTSFTDPFHADIAEAIGPTANGTLHLTGSFALRDSHSSTIMQSL